MMRQVSSILLLGFVAVSPALAQTDTTPACAFTPEYLTAQLGEPFKTGVPEKGIIGMGCKYKGKNAVVWIDAGPNPTPSAEMWLKISNPPGTKSTPITNDPDKAVHINATAGVSPFPSLFYERKGWIVNITVTGTGITDKKSVDAWNAKLAKLKRIP